MQFLKTLFWVVLAVIAAAFAFRNWVPVTVQLWSGLQVDFKLPVLMLLAFLIGLLPTFILHRATRWRLRRRLDTTERALNDARAVALGAVGTAASISDEHVVLPIAPAPPLAPLPPVP